MSSLKQMSKQQARQQKANEKRRANYRTTARREINQMRRLLRHCNHTGINWQQVKDPSYLISIPKEADPKGTIVAAWTRCAERTGAGVARQIINDYRRFVGLPIKEIAA